MGKREHGTIDYGRQPQPKEKPTTRVDDFRATFSTPAGIRVRDFLLNELHVMNPEIQTEEERILRNFGMQFLIWSGSFDPGDPKSLKGFAQALFKGSYSELVPRNAHKSHPSEEEE